MSDTDKLNQGGLMRCCIDTWLRKHESAEFGALSCDYCHAVIRREENGVWSWDRLMRGMEAPS